MSTESVSGGASVPTSTATSTASIQMAKPKLSIVTSKSMITIILSSKPQAADPNVTSVQLQKHKLHIHKDYICYYSPFFDVAFNGNFKEGQTQAIEFDDVDVEAFGILSNWLYTQKIEGSEGKLPDLTILGRVWILGDRFLIPKLQNMAMDKICDKLFNGEDTEKFFEDALIHAIVDIMVWANPRYFDKNSSLIPSLIVAKIERALKQVQASETRFSLQKNWKTGKDYYVKEAFDPTK